MDYGYCFDADFQNNLEAGNVTRNNGIPIQYLRLKRRKSGELKWKPMVDFDYDKDIENYNMEDFYIENGVDMEYTLIPVTQSLEGYGVTNEIETNYSSLYLTGKNSNGDFCNYTLRFDLELSDIVLNEDKSYVKTLSSQTLLGSILRNRINAELKKGVKDFTSIQETIDIFLAGDRITTEQYVEFTEMIASAS